MIASEWGAGPGVYGVGYAVYKDGKQIDWKWCHPATMFGARMAARRFALCERLGMRTPPYKEEGYVVVSRGTFPRTDLRAHEDL